MKMINRVIISGGTHGNEFTGAYLAKFWQKNPKEISNFSFFAEAILSNPKAHQLVRRYVNQDLNRTFKQEIISKNDNDYEIERARQIIKIIESDKVAKADVILDMHSTTANMGLSLILAKKDKLSLEIAAYLTNKYSNVRCYAWIREEINEGFLIDMVPHGLAIEVGPIAQGVLKADIYFQTKELILSALEFLELTNQGHNPADNLPLMLYEHQEMIKYPRDRDNQLQAMIHPEFQGRDFELLKKGDPVFITFSGETITWQAEEAYPVFINEAAYYEKDIAFSITQKRIIYPGH